MDVRFGPTTLGLGRIVGVVVLLLLLGRRLGRHLLRLLLFLLAVAELDLGLLDGILEQLGGGAGVVRLGVGVGRLGGLLLGLLGLDGAQHGLLVVYLLLLVFVADILGGADLGGGRVIGRGGTRGSGGGANLRCRSGSSSSGTGFVAWGTAFCRGSRGGGCGGGGGGGDVGHGGSRWLVWQRVFFESDQTEPQAQFKLRTCWEKWRSKNRTLRFSPSKRWLG